MSEKRQIHWPGIEVGRTYQNWIIDKLPRGPNCKKTVLLGLTRGRVAFLGLNLWLSCQLLVVIVSSEMKKIIITQMSYDVIILTQVTWSKTELLITTQSWKTTRVSLLEWLRKKKLIKTVTSSILRIRKESADVVKSSNFSSIMICFYLRVTHMYYYYNIVFHDRIIFI